MPRTKPRKIIAYIAVSADGYIARPDGGIEWLDRPAPKGNYGMDSFFRSIDTILWGRKTLDFGLTMAGGLGVFGKQIKHYAFSRKPPAKPIDGVEFVKQPIRKFADRIRALPGKNIWMMGGSEIIAAFLDAGAIDEFSIHVIPVFIGDGIRLVAPARRSIPLKLLETKRFSDGVVHLNYEVVRKRTRPSQSRRSKVREKHS